MIKLHMKEIAITHKLLQKMIKFKILFYLGLPEEVFCTIIKIPIKIKKMRNLVITKKNSR